jgi:hypothetical protein
MSGDASCRSPSKAIRALTLDRPDALNAIASELCGSLPRFGARPDNSTQCWRRRRPSCQSSKAVSTNVGLRRQLRKLLNPASRSHSGSRSTRSLAAIAPGLLALICCETISPFGGAIRLGASFARGA